MTQEFTVVAPEMWGDERFASLSDTAKLLWVRLLTGPEVTSVPGVIVVGRAALAEAMGWSPKKLVQTFKEFNIVDERHPEPMAIADWEARVIWLPRSCVHRRRPKNRNQVTGWRHDWRVIPECGLKRRASETIRAFLRTLGETFLDAFDAFDGRICPTGDANASTSNDTHTETTSECSHQTTPEQPSVDPPLARARAISPSSSPSPSSGSDPTCQVNGPPRPEGAEGVTDSPPTASRPSTKLVEFGTVRCAKACEVFTATLAEAGWPRPDLREAWERRALCDAINAHLRADETVEGVLAELRRAVHEWVEAHRDAPQFTAGWGARKFGDWLTTGRKPVSVRRSPAGAAPQAQPRRAPAVLPELR